MAWKVLKDHLEHEGYQNINGSRSATRTAFKIGLLINGQTWMDRIESRNRTVHVYDEKILNIEFLKSEDYYSIIEIKMRQDFCWDQKNYPINTWVCPPDSLFPLFKKFYKKMKAYL